MLWHVKHASILHGHVTKSITIYLMLIVVNKNLEGWEHCTHELNGQVSKEGDGRVEGNGN